VDLLCERSTLRGAVDIPGSKSHTIRAVAIAALAHGCSVIHRPLDSADTRAAVNAYQALGAQVATQGDEWHITGTGGKLEAPDNVIDVGNSGTTMCLALGSASLLPQGLAVLTGDVQVRRRPCGPLAASLNELGANVRSTRDNGTPPLVVEGWLRGGETTIEAVTSQYLSSLLLAAPLAGNDTTIAAPLLNERPYVSMTLDWLARQGVRVAYEDYKRFQIQGGQAYQPVDRGIPGDFSSATFFLAAGALGDNDILLRGLDMNDTQGDRAVVDYLRLMGASIAEEPEGLRVKSGALHGCEIDLNATPDALPMMAVLACFADGTTRLVNIPQARYKETDRISVMRTELERLGARIRELPDGLVIEESALQGATVDGNGDHRVIMALAIAGTQIPGRTVVRDCGAVSVTFPTFFKTLQGLGANVRVLSAESQA
jgi:3-phosphoshikimate 1-carboxyvinyltransferase